MKKMSMYFASATCAVMASLAAIAATYDYSEEGGKALVVTVGSGDEDYLSDDAVAKLNANDVTNLYKRGDGRLIITNNTSSYTGHFWIQGGILTSKPIAGVSVNGYENLTMGKVPATGAEDVAGCGAIHVCNGASFTVDCRGVNSDVATNIRLQDKTTYFEGQGFDNKGALTILNGENGGAGPIGNVFGGYLRMTGPATICNNINNWMGFSNYRYLYMNRYTLTLAGASVGVYEKLWAVSDIGDIVVNTPGLKCTRTMWYGTSGLADSNYTMRVKSGASLQLEARDSILPAFGTLLLEDGARILVNGESSRTEFDLYSSSGYYKHYWNGPLVLDTPGRIKIESAGNYYILFGGKISGGGINLGQNARLILRKHDGAPNDFTLDTNANDFTNGIFAAAGSDVTILWGNLLPENGGDLVLSNASFTVQNGQTYKLPGVRSYGICRFRGRMDNMNDPGERENRQYYPSLYFKCDDAGNCIGQFSTNVVVTALSGLPTIEPYPADTSASPVYPSQATSTGPEKFVVMGSWSIDVSDAVAGRCLALSDGELRFASGVAINVNCDVPDSTVPAEYKIAEADAIVFNGGFNPQTDVTFTSGVANASSDRWRFKVGDDGKSLYLVFKPASGLTLIVK